MPPPRPRPSLRTQVVVCLWRNLVVSSRKAVYSLQALLMPLSVPLMLRLSLADGDVWATVARVILAFYVLLFAPHAQAALTAMVSDKERRLREGMLMSGLRLEAFWFAAYAQYALVAAVVSFLMVWVVRPFFPLSNPLLIYALFLLYDLAAITFSLMWAPFFNTIKAAERFLVFLSFTFFAVPILVFYNEWAPSELSVLLSTLVFYPFGFLFAVLKLNQLEVSNNGATFGNLFKGDGIGWYIVTLFFSSWTYLLLALYFDKVIPQSYGRPRPWYFPLLNLIPGRKPGHALAVDPLNLSTSNPDIEPDPTSLRVIAQIRDLRKIYVRDAGKPPAVGVSLDLYEGEIFALLGHNGAGKSTFMNILTGMIPPTSGSAILGGFDLSTEMSQVRTMIGVCPQENIHCEEMTVREHIFLYAGIKGFWEATTTPQLSELVEGCLREFEMVDKLNDRVASLSGGQKRKLSLALALLGNPKIVLLDEPSNGLDAVSRRALWNLLMRKKDGRLILFSTHLMDEADIVADRKAILTHGRIRCMGTSIFLKTRFQIGYELDIILPEFPPTLDYSTDDGNLMAMANRLIPSAKLIKARRKTASSDAFLRLAVPTDESLSFPALFEELDALRRRGVVLAYGISTPTLEEVFLKTADEDDEELLVPVPDDDAIYSEVDSEWGGEIRALLDNSDYGRAPPAHYQILHLAWARGLIMLRNAFHVIASILPTCLLVFYAANQMRPLNDGDPVGLTSCLIMTLFIVNTPITFAVDAVNDRISKMRLLLRCNGISAGVYWTSMWVVHMVPMTVVVASAVAALVHFKVLAFVGGVAAFGVTAVGLGAYACCLMLTFYVYSLMFDKTDTFLGMSSILTTFFVLIPAIGLEYAFNQNSDATHTLLVVFSFIVPLYSLHGFLFYMSVAYFRFLRGEIPELSLSYYLSPSNLIVVPLAAMFLHSGLMILIIAYFERRSIGGMSKPPQSSEDGRNEEAAAAPEVVDVDVVAERERVADAACDDEIRVVRLCKSFRMPRRSLFARPGWRVAVKDVSFGVGANDTFALLGPNGAGKSTVLGSITGEISPDSGQIHLQTGRGGAVGWCPQHDAVWPLLTVSEHLLLFARLRGVRKMKDGANRWLHSLLDRVGVSEHKDKLVKNVSGGTKRKVCFAVALVGRPECLFLDEPSAGLDPKAKRKLWKIVQSMQETTATVLTTHQLDEADALSTKIGIMVNGSIQRLGTSQHLKSRFGRGFLLEVHTSPSLAAALRARVGSVFPAASLKESFEDLMTRWEVPVEEVERVGGLGGAFALLEGLKGGDEGLIREYSFGQSTLEMVFIEVARQQVLDE